MSVPLQQSWGRRGRVQTIVLDFCPSYVEKLICGCSTSLTEKGGRELTPHQLLLNISPGKKNK